MTLLILSSQVEGEVDYEHHHGHQTSTSWAGRLSIVQQGGEAKFKLLQIIIVCVRDFIHRTLLTPTRTLPPMSDPRHPYILARVWTQVLSFGDVENAFRLGSSKMFFAVNFCRIMHIRFTARIAPQVLTFQMKWFFCVCSGSLSVPFGISWFCHPKKSAISRSHYSIFSVVDIVITKMTSSSIERE